MLGVKRRSEGRTRNTRAVLPESNFSTSAGACAMRPRPRKRRHPRALPRIASANRASLYVYADVGRPAPRRGRRRQDWRSVAREQLHCVGVRMRNAQCAMRNVPAQCTRARANAGIHALCHDIASARCASLLSMRMLGFSAEARSEAARSSGRSRRAVARERSPESNFSASAHACAMRNAQTQAPTSSATNCLCEPRIPLVHADVGLQCRGEVGGGKIERSLETSGRSGAVAREQLLCVGARMRNAHAQTQAPTSSATNCLCEPRIPLVHADVGLQCRGEVGGGKTGKALPESNLSASAGACAMRNVPAQCARARPNAGIHALCHDVASANRASLLSMRVLGVERRGEVGGGKIDARERSPESARPRMSPRKRRHPRALPRRCLCELCIPLVYAGVAKRTKKRHIRGESFRTSSPTIPCPSHLRTRPHRPVLRSRTHTQDNPRNPIHICASV